MKIKSTVVSTLIGLNLLAAPTPDAQAAQEVQTTIEVCVMDIFNNAKADENLTLAQIRQQCSQNQQTTISENVIEDEAQIGLQLKPTFSLGVISQRVMQEKQSESLPYVLLPHKQNYFQPIVTTDKINREAYDHMLGFEENLKDFEFKFQVSLKVPLNEGSWLIENDGLYMGFTLEAWWQIYAGKISKPFRETNYQPEVFYVAPLPWHPFDGNTGFVVGVEHQSNGRGLELSRSWNRVYTHFLFEKDNFGFSFKPWIRWKEDEKKFELDPSGDDNPDIADFLGHYELGMMYQWDNFELGFTGRHNLKTNNGAAEFELTFPLKFLFGEDSKIKGYATAFTGYGDSLIDYNHYQTRFGLGVSVGNAL